MMLQHLPREIVREIFTRLPLDYVIQCKEVCKTWRNILRNIELDKKVNFLFVGKYGFEGRQLYHGEFDERSNKKLNEQLSYNSLTPLGCPNINYIYRFTVSSHRGLVCFHETNNTNDPIYICNPFTQETFRLPQLALTKDPKKGKFLLIIGFGYLYTTNEYKVVRIYYEVDCRLCKGQVHVYTLGDKSGWRNKGTTDHYLRNLKGILFDGALHWIANFGVEIVAFDLADEEFRSFPTPPSFQDKYRYLELLLLGGYLSVVCRRHVHATSTDIWLLKGAKNQSGCGYWSNEFTIRSEDFDQFALTEENKVLMWLNKYTLCNYDPKTATSEEFTDKRFQTFQVIPYMKSDVALAVLMADQPIVSWRHVSGRKAFGTFLILSRRTPVH